MQPAPNGVRARMRARRNPADWDSESPNSCVVSCAVGHTQGGRDGCPVRCRPETRSPPRNDTTMRKTKLISSLLLSATLGAAAFGANAQDHGFYAGAGVGQSNVNEGAYDDNDTGFSVFGGYQFNRYFGL